MSSITVIAGIYNLSLVVYFFSKHSLLLLPLALPPPLLFVRVRAWVA